MVAIPAEGIPAAAIGAGAVPEMVIPVVTTGAGATTVATMEEGGITAATTGLITAVHTGAGIRGRGTIRLIIIRTIRIIPITRTTRRRLPCRQRHRNT